MELSDAMRKKLDRQLAGSDWTVWEATADASAVRCFLYSAHLARGPRIGTQLSAEMFRDMQHGTGVFQEIEKSGRAPTDLYGTAVSAFDGSTDQQQKMDLSRVLILSLAAYARTTQTWGAIPQLSEVPGVHFFAVDWQTPSGRSVVRPLVLFSDGIPPTDVIVEGMSQQLGMHLARFPGEWPVEFDS